MIKYLDDVAISLFISTDYDLKDLYLIRWRILSPQNIVEPGVLNVSSSCLVLVSLSTSMPIIKVIRGSGLLRHLPLFAHLPPKPDCYLCLLKSQRSDSSVTGLMSILSLVLSLLYKCYSVVLLSPFQRYTVAFLRLVFIICPVLRLVNDTHTLQMSGWQKFVFRTLEDPSHSLYNDLLKIRADSRSRSLF